MGRNEVQAKEVICIILKKGRISQRFKMKIQKEEIPMIVDNSIKCLGKWFDATLKDTGQVKSIQPTVKSWLKKVDKITLPGKYKA